MSSFRFPVFDNLPDFRTGCDVRLSPSLLGDIWDLSVWQLFANWYFYISWTTGLLEQYHVQKIFQKMRLQSIQMHGYIMTISMRVKQVKLEILDGLQSPTSNVSACIPTSDVIFSGTFPFSSPRTFGLFKSRDFLVPGPSGYLGPGTFSPGTQDLLSQDFPGRPGTFISILLQFLEVRHYLLEAERCFSTTGNFSTKLSNTMFKMNCKRIEIKVPGRPGKSWDKRSWDKRSQVLGLKVPGPRDPEGPGT